MNRPSARKFLSASLGPSATRVSNRLGLSPNRITLLGLLIAGASAYLLSVGQFALGGAALLVAGVFDLLDGAVARATNRVTTYGAFLDSISDRVSEAVALLGLLVYYLARSSTSEAVLVYVALASSLMVSYIRARAEGLGIECDVGVMTRPERVALLATGLIVGQWWLPATTVVLAAIAALALLTSVQRMLHVRKTLAEGGSSPGDQAGTQSGPEIPVDGR